jgi:DNA mismatch repair protein MutS
MSLIKEYFELTTKYQNDYGNKTILLMQVGSFFEVYGIREDSTNDFSGSQIKEFANVCELNIVNKNLCVGKKNVVMSGFKTEVIEKYLKKIQSSGFTVVVYTQDQQSKNTTRSCAGVFSPGTYFSTEPSKLTNNVCCIWIELVNQNFIQKGKKVIVGIANIDIYTGKSNVYQFKETYLNNPTTFDELERFISIYTPSETILISNLDDTEIDDIINYTNITSLSIHRINLTNENNKSQFFIRAKNCEKQNYQKEIIDKFYKTLDHDDLMMEFYENEMASQAFCFLLDFVFQHNPHLVMQISKPKFENCEHRLHLANYSLKQLNIIDDGNYKGKYSSVITMLNDCLTPMGKRDFIYRFTNPITDVNKLNKEYDITEYLIDQMDSYQDLKGYLSSIKDLSKMERQLFLKKITPKSFFNLNDNLESIKNIFCLFQRDETILDYLSSFNKHFLSIPVLCSQLSDFININLNLEMALQLDQLQNFELNFIQSNVNEDLDKTYNLLLNSEAKLESIRYYLNSLIIEKSKTTDFIKIHETEKNNFNLICTNRRCKLLETSLPSTKTNVTLNYTINNDILAFDYLISKNHLEYKNQSAANNSISDDEIKKLCKTISSIKISLKDKISFVFNKFVSEFCKFQNDLRTIIEFTTIIDVIYNKSKIAIKYNYCKPVIRDASKSFVDVVNLRHALIENLQSNELYIANDILLGNGKSDGLLLYGTNAVGKTSFIRALGISVIMAQAGLFVPCSEFTFKPYNYIFTRILGNDNLFKGLSTFAVEMSELRTILRLSNENSLILGDELCSGTEIMSAISIFVSGIQALSKLKSSFIFATHLHEIVNYEEITSIHSIQLKHMEVIYNREQDKLIYDRQLKDGPGNSMYGLEVCKSLSLPDDFIANAYNIRMKYNPEENSLLDLKTSHYNAKKIISLCEKCGINKGEEVHHLQFQKEANEKGIIKKGKMTFHKNNLANLITLCEKCHKEIHENNSVMKKSKTSKGYELLSI